jgi:hypothetical protein
MCRQTRTCFNCAFEEERTLRSLDAAFEHSRIWDAPCPRCASTKVRGSFTETPELSAEQLAVWAVNKNAHFSSQDEDILIARPESLELVLQFLDDTRTLTSKRKVLLAALFAIIYDNLGQKRNDPAIVSRASAALRERRLMIRELGTRHISGRILRHVIPRIGA